MLGLFMAKAYTYFEHKQYQSCRRTVKLAIRLLDANLS